MARARTLYVAMLLAALTIVRPIVATADEQLPRVAVLTMTTSDTLPHLEPVAIAVRQTLVLTLRLLGHYEVIDEDSGHMADPGTTADRLRADTLVWGRIDQDDTGAVEASLTVFDRLEGRAVQSDSERSRTMLGVFDAVDALLGRVVEAFSGVRVGFASLQFRPVGLGTYRVRLGDTIVGSDITTLERVLAGDHELTIEQEWVDGYRPLLQTSLSLREGIPVTIDFELLDVEELVRADVERLLGELDVALSYPGGAGSLPELIGHVDQLSAYGVDPRLVSWQRRRVDLEREYHRVIDSSAELVEGRVISSMTLESLTEVARRTLADTEALLIGTGDDLHEPLGDLSERAYQTIESVAAMVLLSSDYQLVKGAYDEHNRLLQVLQRFLDEQSLNLSVLSRGVAQRARQAQGFVDAYNRARDRAERIEARGSLGTYITMATGSLVAAGATAYLATRRAQNALDWKEPATIGVAVGGGAGLTALAVAGIRQLLARDTREQEVQQYLATIEDARLTAAEMVAHRVEHPLLVAVDPAGMRAGSSHSVRVDGGVRRVLTGGTVIDGVQRGTRVEVVGGWPSQLPDNRLRVVHRGVNAVLLGRDPAGSGSLAIQRPGDHIRVGHAGAFDVIENTVTMQAWVNLDRDEHALDSRTPYTNSWVLSKQNIDSVNGSHRSWGFFVENRTRQVMPSIATATGHFESPVGPPVPVGRWVNLAVVYDGAQILVYHDGELRGSVPKTGRLVLNRNPLTIGGTEWTGSDRFAGSLSSVRVWNAALTSREVAASMRGSTPQPDRLVADYPLNHTSIHSGRANDVGPNKLHGVLSGTAAFSPSLSPPVGVVQPTDLTHMTGRVELTLAGTIGGSAFRIDSLSAAVHFHRPDEQWPDGLLRVTSDDVGVEFRNLLALDGSVGYSLLHDDIEMGIWCPPVIEPILGFNNLPVESGSVVIEWFDRNHLIGHYRLRGSDGPDYPNFDVSGTFWIEFDPSTKRALGARDR
jgi:hypothetical protein